MSHTLLVKVKKAEGSILRLLGQIGRRGYDILGVTAKLTADGLSFDVVVEFEPILPAPPAPHQYADPDKPESSFFDQDSF